MSRVSLTRVGTAALFALAVQPFHAFATTLPSGFTEVVVASGLSSPTSFAFLPDGRILVTEKGGRIRVIKNDVLLGTPAITLAVNSQVERGALCVTPDPQFSSNHFVYIYYTTSSGSFQPSGHSFVSPKNRVSRFTMSGDSILAGTEVVILDDIFSDAGNHNGGWIQFGPAGKLYISTGDGGSRARNSQELTNLSGKILRINSDGSVPTDNPFFTTPDALRSKIWCYGLRNPWRNTWDSAGRLFIGDVGSGGSNAFEEINVGVPGMNYGWPDKEGVANTPGFVDPIYTYPHGSGASITVGVFSNGAAYPAQYAGSLFFGDFVQSFIRTLKYNAGNGTGTPSPFGSSAGGPVHFANGPNGLLYYASINTGQIRRIEFPSKALSTPVPANYDGDNRADIATFTKPGVWFVKRSSDGGTSSTSWGTVALKDVPVPADYNGDGMADIAVYRPDVSKWRILLSTGGSSIIDWGTPSFKETPVPADYDDDNVTDLAVWSAMSTPNPRWLIRRSSDLGATTVEFGLAGDIPVPGDYDGDGNADIAVFRPSTVQWLVLPSLGGGTQTTAFGQLGDKPVQADFDGDGTTDFAIFRPSNGLWLYRPSSGGVDVGLGWGAGSLGDIPVPADFDGDGKADRAVFRKGTGQWFIRRSSDGGTTIYP